MTEPQDLAALFSEHRKACEDYEAAQKVESVARGRTTTALNALNEAQRAIDLAIDEQRKVAPMDSDWGRNRRRGMLEVRE